MMEDRELWALMRINDELAELEDQAAQLRIVKYLVDRFGLGWLVTNKAKPDTEVITTEAQPITE